MEKGTLVAHIVFFYWLVALLLAVVGVHKAPFFASTELQAKLATRVLSGAITPPDVQAVPTIAMRGFCLRPWPPLCPPNVQAYIGLQAPSKWNGLGGSGQLCNMGTAIVLGIVH